MLIITRTYIGSQYPYFAINILVKLPSNQKINPELRASLSAKDALDNTALHYAAKNGNS